MRLGNKTDDEFLTKLNEKNKQFQNNFLDASGCYRFQHNYRVNKSRSRHNESRIGTPCTLPSRYNTLASFFCEFWDLLFDIWEHVLNDGHPKNTRRRERLKLSQKTKSNEWKFEILARVERIVTVAILNAHFPANIRSAFILIRSEDRIAINENKFGGGFRFQEFRWN